MSLSGTANGFNTLGSPIGSVLNGTSPINIQNAVQLTADAISLSNTVSVGQQFGVLVTVTNTAGLLGATANGVSVTGIVSQPAGALSLVSALPAGVALAGNQVTGFNFVFQAA